MSVTAQIMLLTIDIA